MADRLKKAEWVVRSVPIGDARTLVDKYHYARGAANTATYLHGLFMVDELFSDFCWGVAWWIPPTKSAALATYPDNWQGVLCLSRLVMVPGAPTNACSFLLARSRKLICSETWPCLVTYADEWRGHTGAIYRADNWQYWGRTQPESTWVLGRRLVARKAGPRTRTHAEMLDLGAVMVGRFAKHKFVRTREHWLW